MSLPTNEELIAKFESSTEDEFQLWLKECFSRTETIALAHQAVDSLNEMLEADTEMLANDPIVREILEANIMMELIDNHEAVRQKKNHG